jgi:hypothetical protein
VGRELALCYEEKVLAQSSLVQPSPAQCSPLQPTAAHCSPPQPTTAHHSPRVDGDSQ